MKAVARGWVRRQERAMIDSSTIEDRDRTLGELAEGVRL